MRVIYIILATAGWIWTALLMWVVYRRLRVAPRPAAPADHSEHDQ